MLRGARPRHVALGLCPRTVLRQPSYAQTMRGGRYGLSRNNSRRGSCRQSPDEKVTTCFSARSVTADLLCGSLPRAVGGGGSGKPAFLEVLTIPPEEFASQITRADWEVFKRIQPDELACLGWNRRDKHILSPNVVAFTRRFNQVSFWTVKEILNVRSVKQRAEVLGLFIRVAKRLQEFNNLHGQFAIISALQTAPIYRLQKMWAHLPKNVLQKFEKQRELFLDVNNWEKLRDLLSRAKLPCIPYLGLYLTDLVYVDMAHPQSGGLESSQRRNLMNNILRTISEFQQSDFSHLPFNPRVSSYLASIRYIDELQKFIDEDNYKLSLQLEPQAQSPAQSSSSRESAEERDRVAAAVPPSPARQTTVQAHRRACSLGVNLPDSTARAERHLLDDSVLSTADGMCTSLYLPDGGAGGTADDDVTATLPMLDSEEDGCLGMEAGAVCTLQGCLRRKTLLKSGRRPPVATWQRYWVQLWSQSLVYFSCKKIKCTERSDFKSEPSKMHTVRHWSVHVDDVSWLRDTFILQNPASGDMYKFRACSQTKAEEWVKHLHDAAVGVRVQPLPANLMSFE
ncbi:ras-specific guanine nucleotide-releasing factor RalGPS2-like isoform X9 [Amphibalanus amphitrite]|uniref:ras-specific guanine nucleotide-releasing factor RalGPS2-like isoform X9 n=1 Tax=Amphibalanus amphitrite TaxID=1232801 RepID=UPI001C9216DF|nr:ras-specific guanine nucleotide-releasing factor RalGPS2-like isoform X9 [Amphibalanus amphitrite]XP_043231353.1 ras-specific guanine nucleotide-releasing factor RalGPS2-like isoform X9 [Amphibalanus amphitrite]